MPHSDFDVVTGPSMPQLGTPAPQQPRLHRPKERPVPQPPRGEAPRTDEQMPK